MERAGKHHIDLHRAGGHKKIRSNVKQTILIFIYTSTLDTAWSKILSDANKEASDHTNLAESLSNEVCEVLKTCEKKKEATRKRHVEFGVKLLAERDKIYHDRAKAKQRYDDACSLVESTRVKQGQAKDDKHLEKAAKNMDVHTNEILSAKNAYLLSISVANEVKRRFYHVDLPSLEDDSQSIWSLTASELVSLLKTVSQLNGKYLESLRCKTQKVLVKAFLLNGEGDGWSCKLCPSILSETRPTKLSLAS
ncbi:hypothetical protein Pst134EA_003328 [Puccinia striiformis f. sp. tritici]|uniref:hypothetical protein n=1 Tax=Puccinia striiformis f. sp. tritici TaxID=168172 RepID=UPI0020086414|nr:hypothetical protein Pst134EA_003328 [Puccinia striiformis f. sp. tritici]KAH9472720.1 hypothetical protein Pst134EA_003328 [Puccinia striiformis f. sp. tritici]